MNPSFFILCGCAAAIVLLVGRWWNSRSEAAAAEDSEPLRDNSAAVVDPADSVSAAAAAKKSARVAAFQTFEALDEKLAAIGANPEARQKFREDVSALIALSAKP